MVGVDSPSEDKKERMAYQMQRLVEGIGSQQGGQEELLLVHVNGFITIRPSAIYVERFRAGIDAEKNKKTKDK